MRIDRNEQVGLLTCSNDHHSLLLDSSDYWDDVIQDGKPREKVCRCKSRQFVVGLDYELRDDDSVRNIGVAVRCVACGRESIAATFEIDYGPTDDLVTRPLEPCDDPWLTAKRSEVTALWTPSDLEDLVRYVGESEHVICYYAGFDERPRVATPSEICIALGKDQFFHLYFATREIEFPDDLRDCWKRLPLIHIATPMSIIYRTGPALMYYVQWADQFLVERRIVSQERDLLALATRLQQWLRARFTSARGKRTFDNPAEYDRLKGGW